MLYNEATVIASPLRGLAGRGGEDYGHILQVIFFIVLFWGRGEACDNITPIHA